MEIPMVVKDAMFRAKEQCVQDESEKLKAREDKIEEAKKQKTLKNRDEDFHSARWKQSSWTGLLHPHLVPGENGAQTRRVGVLIGNHQPIGVEAKRVTVPIGS